MFFLIGPALVTWLTWPGPWSSPPAGLVRWAVMAQSAAVLAPLCAAAARPDLALLHLACMRLLARIVPPGLEGRHRRSTAAVGIGALCPD